jgi:hypothetical protein
LQHLACLRSCISTLTVTFHLCSLRGGLGFLGGGFLFLGVGGEELFVLLEAVAGGLVAANDFSLVLSLSAETGLGDQALDLG